jgi:hypothetical protein
MTCISIPEVRNVSIKKQGDQESWSALWEFMTFVSHLLISPVILLQCLCKTNVVHYTDGLTTLRNVRFNKMMFVNTLRALWKEDAISTYFIMKNLHI